MTKLTVTTGDGQVCRLPGLKIQQEPERFSDRELASMSAALARLEKDAHEVADQAEGFATEIAKEMTETDEQAHATWL